MADDNELTLKDPAAGKKKKLIMVVALAVIVLGGGGAGAWLMLSGGDKPAAEASAEGKDAKPKEEAAQPSLYVGMPRPFVFNVSGGQRDRLVQIKIQLMVRGAADETLAKQNVPLIEGTLLRVFSAATSEQLMTFEGKEKLRKDSLEECRRVLNDLVSSPVIEQVLFTGFVMQ
ncbi:flagellar basal body-associated protein FliL [Aeromonas sp. MR19]|jgi:flagellar protein FliL|uniref:Flagellar protein FliL n=1 Tax=Aeromonas bestiarum TaxID=105751 RepID=A0ABT7PW28_9GAMM|nr:MULTISPECIES: flagellar basal body-associated protein FliL [Aeromonas]EKP0280128.1 flagellar basal body-associated protein FliL [Aeromonas bestiarum]KFN21087.1 flagellar basal body-associated protein FliL [Aeromonas bestiarum]MCH7346349.1 flagellar basal body-associated protein FliL [Aeromonas sp. MR7]MCH7377002.1 flagellar basal body-associated protein FliL [Aeromonas sp. MR19]MDM5070896.1 flagellar basal body-associated protein FliL [Aeromonas bestiarum]